MKLADWIKGRAISRSEAAKRIGISQSYLTELCQGKVSPGIKVIKAIDQATDGAVQARDFYQEAAA